MKATSVEQPNENGQMPSVGTGDWFDLPEFAATKRKRVSHHAEVRRLKELHGIWTDHCPDLGWMALSVPQCMEALKGYSLTEEERTMPIALVAGYGRLLEEAGLLIDGASTELLACQAVAERLGSNVQDQTRSE